MAEGDSELDSEQRQSDLVVLLLISPCEAPYALLDSPIPSHHCAMLRHVQRETVPDQRAAENGPSQSHRYRNPLALDTASFAIFRSDQSMPP